MHDSSSEPGSPAFAASLRLIHDELWIGLVRAAADRRHGWHLIALGTIDAGGASDPGVAFPDVRCVVLRRADPERRSLLMHTDVRSRKRRDLEANPRSCVLAYDAKGRRQLRMRGIATLHTDGPLVDRQWAVSRPMSRRCYLAPLAPGTVSAAPTPNLPDDLLTSEPDAARSEAGRANFGVVEFMIDRIEWLRLAHDGHQRAVFVYDPADRMGEPVASWLAP